MGTSSLLDVIGSFATFGVLLLLTLRLNMSASEARQTYGYNYRNQTNLTILMMMMEDDFSRIGYSTIPNDPQVTPPAGCAICATDSNRFRYKTTINFIGTIDSVEYSISNTPNISITSNPNDRYLNKIIWLDGVQQDTQKWNLGVTRFNFQYLRSGTEGLMLFPIDNSAANLAVGNTPRNVGLIRLDVKLESPEKPKQEFLGDTSQYQVFWRQVRVTSKNLLYR
jgi:hypothetical protein